MNRTLSSSDVSSGATGEDRRPPWTPDESVTKCYDCAAEFTPLNRKHHCRACGLIFCSKCSSRTAPLPDLGYTSAVRVCDICSELQLVRSLAGSDNVTLQLQAATSLRDMLQKNGEKTADRVALRAPSHAVLLLGSSHEDVRCAAAEAMAQLSSRENPRQAINNPQTVSALFRLLTVGEDRTKMNAIEALAGISKIEGSRLQLSLNLGTILNLQTKNHKWKVQTQCYFLLANLCLTPGSQDRVLAASGSLSQLVQALSAPITIDAAHVQSLAAFLAIARTSPEKQRAVVTAGILPVLQKLLRAPNPPENVTLPTVQLLQVLSQDAEARSEIIPAYLKALMLPLNSESETIRRTTAEYLCAMADLSSENLEAVCKEYAASVAFANIKSPKAKIRIQALETLRFMSPLTPVQELATQTGITEMLIRLKISEEADERVKEIAESILKQMIR